MGAQLAHADQPQRQRLVVSVLRAQCGDLVDDQG
jgi:hypothetical protein